MNNQEKVLKLVTKEFQSTTEIKNKSNLFTTYNSYRYILNKLFDKGLINRIQINQHNSNKYYLWSLK